MDDDIYSHRIKKHTKLCLVCKEVNTNCNHTTYNCGLKLRVPRKSDKRGWVKLRREIENGNRFFLNENGEGSYKFLPIKNMYCNDYIGNHCIYTDGKDRKWCTDIEHHYPFIKWDFFPKEELNLKTDYKFFNKF